MLKDVDPILEYLLDFNEEHKIEYTSRYMIPVGGLQKMLDNFGQYHLNRIEVIKDELRQTEPVVEDTEEAEETIEELYELL
jgi:hypothetical protein